MDDTNKVVIGEASYEIAREFGDRRTISDIIRDMLIENAKNDKV